MFAFVTVSGKTKTPMKAELVATATVDGVVAEVMV